MISAVDRIRSEERKNFMKKIEQNAKETTLLRASPGDFGRGVAGDVAGERRRSIGAGELTLGELVDVWRAPPARLKA